MMNAVACYRRLAALAALTLLLVVLPALPSAGQETPAFGRQEQTWSSIPAASAPDPAPAPAAWPQADTFVFLPAVTRLPIVTITFGSGRASNGDLTGIATTFDFGLRRLWYQYRFEGARNRTYRDEWTINGRVEPGLARSDRIPFDNAQLTSSICLVNVSTGACTDIPLPRGTYNVKVYVDEQLLAQSTATIR